MSKSRQEKKQRQRARPEKGPAKTPPKKESQDIRLISARIEAAADAPGINKGDIITVVSQVVLPGGETFGWYPPQAVAYSLAEAKVLCDRAAPRRESIVNNRVVHHDTINKTTPFSRPQSAHALIEVFSDLWSAVLHSFAAIEAFANNVVEVLDDDKIQFEGETYTREAIVRKFSTADKLKKFVPMHQDCQHVAGDSALWDNFHSLKGLRDDLVHVKNRNVNSDATANTAYDRIVIGDADQCALHAFEIVEAAWPGFLPEHVVDALKPS